MNPRIAKINGEINRTKIQITELQDKITMLEEQKCDFENNDVINLLRKKHFNEDDLITYIRSLRESGQEIAKPPQGKIREVTEENYNEM